MDQVKMVDHNTDTLWVLAKVKDSTCALDSKYVESILLLEEQISRMPHSDEVHVGVIHYRGGVLPVVDLRRKMGIKSQQEEEREFDDMLDQRKQDHIHWVDELKRCLAEDDKFNLAIDPHKCAFGRWYDSYTPTSQSVAFQLKKVEEPHRKLHETAQDVCSCKQECDQCAREKCLKTVLKEGTEVYMHQVLGLLEDAKEAFHQSYHRMVVVLSDGHTSCGLLVDEVLSVEKLVEVSENRDLTAVEDNPLVTVISQRENDPELVLVLNRERLMELPVIVKEEV